MNAVEEQERLTELLNGKNLKRVLRHRPTEVVIEFTDGSCLIVELNGESLEFSVTGPKKI